MKATTKDLRFHSKQLMDTVRRGEEVLITFRGKPYAKLVPLTGEPERTESEEHDLFGIWSDYYETAGVEEYVDKTRESRF